MSSSMFQTHYFEVAPQRRLALSCVGSAKASRRLLCLPGLLETRATFDPLLGQAALLEDVQVISLDHCGRGESDSLPGDVGYTMSQYLDDLVALFQRHEAFQTPADWYVLGTSMGGILGMYLAQRLGDSIKGLVFNDVGLSLHWVSLYSLYGVMKKSGALKNPSELAQKLGVSPGVLAAVQMPTHFDLSYRRDLRGMHFDHVLKGFAGYLGLVRGRDSTICLVAQVRELERLWPQAKVLEVAHAAHPVPLTQEVIQFVLTPLQAQVAFEVPVTEAPRPSFTHGSSSSVLSWWRRLRSGLGRS